MHGPEIVVLVEIEDLLYDRNDVAYQLQYSVFVNIRIDFTSS